MKKLFILLIASLLSILSPSLWALDTPPQPDKCPDIAHIQKTSFFSAKILADGLYGAVQVSSYDTSTLWVFVLAHIAASSVQDALDKARAALISLGLISGPTYSIPSKVWTCLYYTNSGYLAAALTPLSSQDIQVDSILREVI